MVLSTFIMNVKKGCWVLFPIATWPTYFSDGRETPSFRLSDSVWYDRLVNFINFIPFLVDTVVGVFNTVLLPSRSSSRAVFHFIIYRVRAHVRPDAVAHPV